MNILLVNPRFNGKAEIPPLGLEYVAASLLDLDMDVSILDLDVECVQNPDETLRQRLHDDPPDIVGVTSLSNSFASARQILRMVKEKTPEALTVLGGVHASVLYHALMARYRDIDVIVRGEGETVFAELVQRHLKRHSFENIQGVSYRVKDNIIHNEDRPLSDDLDAYPLPAHHLVENRRYRSRSISSSRGCAHACIFCSIQTLYRHVVRTRSVQSLMEEIEGLIHYGARRIMFTDDNFTFSLNRVRELCHEITRHGYHQLVTFFAQGRMDDICRNPMMAGMLSAAGFQALYIGAESGSADMLSYYRKRMLPDDFRRGVSLCVEQNLTPVVNFILFGPKDTHATILETLRFARQLFENGAEIAYTEAMIPYPGTPIRAMLEREGRYRENGDSYYFDSCEGIEMVWLFRLCDFSRCLTLLLHEADQYFDTRRVYYEFCYLEELLSGRMPADLEKARLQTGDLGEKCSFLYGQARELLNH